MSDPLSPPAIEARAADALPPYLANGIIGIRHPGLPHLPGTTMVNGFAGLIRRTASRGSLARRTPWRSMSGSAASGHRPPRSGSS